MKEREEKNLNELPRTIKNKQKREQQKRDFKKYHSKIKKQYEALGMIPNEKRQKKKLLEQSRRAKERTATLSTYKIEHIGDNLKRLTRFKVPIKRNYQRAHTPKRKEGRTMANEQNIKRARKKVFDIVEANKTPYTKMLTLTYAETNLNYDQLAKDWKAFLLNLKRKGYKFPYLAITEHQTERGKKEGNEGSLHVHALLFTDEYIPFPILKSAWGSRGSVDIQAKFSTAKKQGAYVAKYITKEGAPPDKKTYRTSRDIKKVRKSWGHDVTDIVTEIPLGQGFSLSNQYYYSIEAKNGQAEKVTLQEVIIETYEKEIEKKNEVKNYYCAKCGELIVDEFKTAKYQNAIDRAKKDGKNEELKTIMLYCKKCEWGS